MPNAVTQEVALTLKRGDILYHNILSFGGLDEEKTPATCKVLGKCRILKQGNVERYELPIQRLYCGNGKGTLTWMSRDLWRTTEMPDRPRRVVRTRVVAKYDEPEVEVVPPRVRRTRSR